MLARSEAAGDEQFPLGAGCDAEPASFDPLNSQQQV
jgi:hypothetical protein